MTSHIQAHSWEDLTILLPTKNEEDSIRAVIEEICQVGSPQILLADSSSDSTSDIAARLGARTVYTPPRGKGYAVNFSLFAIDTPYVIMMNADLTYPAEYLPLLYSLLRYGFDVVVGHRSMVDKGAMPLLHSIGNFGLSSLASLLYLRRVYDVCSGMWGFRTEALKSFNLKSYGFTLEADLLTNTFKRRLKFAQIPIGYRKRGGSESKLTVADGLKIAQFLVKERFGRCNTRGMV